MATSRPRELRLPDLGVAGHVDASLRESRSRLGETRPREMAGQAARLSVWLVEDGSEVSEGDRLVEILVGNATVDLPAPASGVLRHILRGEDEPVTPGQLLGVIEETVGEE